MFIYLQTDYEMHWILRIFYRIFWISIFNTCSYGELFTGVSPEQSYQPFFVVEGRCRIGKLLNLALNFILSALPIKWL